MSDVSDFEHGVAIPMRITRCFSCGRFYAHERHHNDPGCPGCAKATARKLRGLVDRLERSNSAFRGAAKRRKKAANG